MAKLIYVTPTSLDGYIADETGDFDWAAPDEEVHAFINDIVCPSGTYLYGRKMYQTMAVWRRQMSFPVGRRPSWTSPESGKRLTKSSIPNRWRPSPHGRRVSSGNSIPRWFAT
jgi:dihydrofolate reductase